MGRIIVGSKLDWEKINVSRIGLKNISECSSEKDNSPLTQKEWQDNLKPKIEKYLTEKGYNLDERRSESDWLGIIKREFTLNGDNLIISRKFTATEIKKIDNYRLKIESDLIRRTGFSEMPPISQGPNEYAIPDKVVKMRIQESLDKLDNILHMWDIIAAVGGAVIGGTAIFKGGRVRGTGSVGEAGNLVDISSGRNKDFVSLPTGKPTIKVTGLVNESANVKDTSSSRNKDSISLPRGEPSSDAKKDAIKNEDAMKEKYVSNIDLRTAVEEGKEIIVSPLNDDKPEDVTQMKLVAVVNNYSPKTREHGLTSSELKVLSDVAKTLVKPNEVRRTVGIFIADDGRIFICKSGGEQGQKYHVEGKAVTTMVKNNITKGTLLIGITEKTTEGIKIVRNEPCRACDRSNYSQEKWQKGLELDDPLLSTRTGEPIDRQTPRICSTLPVGFQLTVVLPDSAATYKGTKPVAPTPPWEKPLQSPKSETVPVINKCEKNEETPRERSPLIQRQKTEQKEDREESSLKSASNREICTKNDDSFKETLDGKSKLNENMIHREETGKKDESEKNKEISGKKTQSPQAFVKAGE